MAQNALTVQQVVKRGLRFLGVTSLDPANPTGQQFPIEPTDLDDVLGCLNAAFQRYFKDAPSEVRESNVGGYLNGPANVTLNLTAGSGVIASFSGFSAWMLGCTIRVTGDSQDNEVTSQTLLARPFMGSTGTAVTAQVFADCLQLDWTISEVLDPVFIASPTQTLLFPCKTREEFAMVAGFPLVTAPDGSAFDWPFYWIVRKTDARPLWWYLESAYSSPLGYVPRRIRLAPMPDSLYAIGYRAVSTATRYISTDAMNNDFTDPGILLPINDGDVESLLMPIFVKCLSGLPTFKNSATMPQIAANYKDALADLDNIRAQAATPSHGHYR